MRNVRVYEEAWPLHTPFVIARGSRSEAKVVVVELEEDGVKGVGECTPYPRYGESIASVCGEVIVYAWVDRRRENSEKPYGTRLRAGLAVSARLVGK